jgi:hypothetical protein
MPYPPAGSGFRSDFDLLKLVRIRCKDRNDPDDPNYDLDHLWRPAGEGEGRWYCSEHRQERQAQRKGKYYAVADTVEATS